MKTLPFAKVWEEQLQKGPIFYFVDVLNCEDLICIR